MKALEEDVERSLAREEAMRSGEAESAPSTPSMDDVQALQRSYKELKTKYEVRSSSPISYGCSLIFPLQTEVEQLRKRLADVEMKSARQVHDVCVSSRLFEATDDAD